MHLLDELHVYDDREPKSAAMNMAIDEALLESVTAPSLRFYGWRGSSLSFGYFGSFAEIAEEAKHCDLVRRWTGGGIVRHGSDLTYSIILPAGAAQNLTASRIIYAEVHKAIQRALAPYLAVELALQDGPKLSDACFANAVTADVVANGKKIAGAAQRRTRAGLLHQGSIQNTTLPEGFADTFSGELCANFTRKHFRAGLLDRAYDLATAKYGTETWLRRR